MSGGQITVSRKTLKDIQAQFESVESTPLIESDGEVTDNSEQGSLTASLQKPKKKPTKIRFTLDLEKPLDSRLTKAANKLNRPKAEVTRIALERLLDELEEEWSS